MRTTAVVLPAGYTLCAFPSLISTGDAARVLVAEPTAGLDIPRALVVWAATQTGGRGRDGRSWHSPPGNLYFTVVYRDLGPPLRTVVLSLAAAVAVADAVVSVWPGGRRLTCKWPNDLLLGGAKVCGILLEADRDWLTIGVGVNVAHAPVDTPYPATALRAHGCDVALEEILSACLERLAFWLERWRREGPDPVRRAWLVRTALRPEENMTVRLPDGRTRSGGFAGLDKQGALRLRTATGIIETVTAGDVFGAWTGREDRADATGG